MLRNKPAKRDTKKEYEELTKNKNRYSTFDSKNQVIKQGDHFIKFSMYQESSSSITSTDTSGFVI